MNSPTTNSMRPLAGWQLMPQLNLAGCTQILVSQSVQQSMKVS